MAYELLYKSQGARVTRDPSGRVLVYSAPRFLYALLFLMIVFVFTPLAIALLVITSSEFIKGQQGNVFALVCFGPVALMVLAIVLLSGFATLAFAFPRQCEIDANRGVATFRHFPGLIRSVALSDITTVDIVLVSSEGGHGCFLGVSQAGSERIHWIHTIASRWDSQQQLRDCMKPLAELIAHILNRPIECSIGAARWLNTVKVARFDE